MKKLFTILPLVFLLCFAFACQQAEQVAEEPAVNIAAEKAAILEVVDTLEQAGRTRDVELVMSILADDLFLADGRDREVLPEWYADYFSKGNYWGPGTIDKIEISASGDIAYTIISWEFFNEESSNGKSTNVVVWGKQADGTWKMVAW